MKAHDPIELAIFKSAFHAIAQEMGTALRRTAFSPNIKERRDYSSAIFNPRGEVVAMGDDMPVHLGSMPMSVRAALDALDLEPDDIAILNDPYDGGTHLPDITLVRRGEVQHDLLRLILNNIRTPREREGDLTAQIGACRIGAGRLRDMVVNYGRPRVERNMAALCDHSERLMRAELRKLPAGTFTAEDFLDNDGLSDRPVRLRVAITLDPRRARARIDFTGSDPQVEGSVNAVAAITWSAAFYVFRCLL